MWVLVRNPDEPVTGPELSLAGKWQPERWPGYRDQELPEIEAFKTGFKDASVETIAAFVQENANPNPENRDDLSLAQDDFIVLDARSAEDNTCLAYTWNCRMSPARLREDCNAWGGSDMIYEWIEWRIHFLVAAHWIFALHEAPVLGDFEIGQGMYFNDKGILLMPEIERDENMVAGLTEEDKEACPWGLEKDPEDEFDDDEDPEDWEFDEADFVRCVEKGLIKTYPAAQPQK